MTTALPARLQECSVKRLKQLCEERGVDCAACVEKDDLVEALLHHAARGGTGTKRRESVHARLRQAAQELGVAPDASDTDVRAAYKALARRWHPDRARELEGGAPTEAATDKFKEMKAAYDMLTSMTAEARAAAVAKAKKRAQQQFAPTPSVPAADAAALPPNASPPISRAPPRADVHGEAGNRGPAPLTAPPA